MAVTAPPGVTTKVCTGCREAKPFSAFVANKHTKYGLAPRCRECRNRHYRDSYRANRGDAQTRSLARNRKHRYGLVGDEYDAFIATAGSKCALCGATQRLGIDHDHASKALRGVLCRDCNLALGLFRDSVEVLRAAVAYLSGEDGVLSR